VADICVIDDDEQLLRMVGLILERGDHKVSLFSDPRKGLAHIAQQRPDLLVLDVMMPRMSGHEVAREIRSLEGGDQLPILILTARSQPIDQEAAIRSGATDFLGKPVVPEQLLQRINSILSGEPEEGYEPKGFVISVIGLRGGVGRTTVAVNLTAAMLRASRRIPCLVDLSPSGGQAATHFRLQATTHWGSLLKSGRSPSGNELDDILLHHNSGLRVLAAPPTPLSPDQPGATWTEAIITQLRQAYSFVVIDCPPVLSAGVRTAMAKSDMVLHLVAPDPVSVHQVLQTNRVLGEGNRSQPQTAYILNRVTPGGLDPKLVEKGLGARVSFHIEYDPNQAKALSHGTPLSLTKAQSSIPTTVVRMGEVIWQRILAEHS
jgi:pilus assembly protein CpaE